MSLPELSTSASAPTTSMLSSTDPLAKYLPDQSISTRQHTKDMMVMEEWISEQVEEWILELVMIWRKEENVRKNSKFRAAKRSFVCH